MGKNLNGLEIGTLFRGPRAFAFLTDAVAVAPVSFWAAATTSTRPVPLSNDVVNPPPVV